MTAIAIDDEPAALRILENFAGRVPFLELKESFTDAFHALDYLQRQPVDLLFLDIKMPDLSGIEFLKSLHRPPMVVFTTAYSEHAVEGFNLDAVDYLLKPFAFARFLKACQKAFAHIRTPEQSDYLMVKTGYEQVRVKLADILYLEAGGNYVVFVLAGNQKIASRLTMQEAQEILPFFKRIHRSYLINTEKIEKVDRYEVKIGEKLLPIGVSYRESR